MNGGVGAARESDHRPCCRVPLQLQAADTALRRGAGTTSGMGVPARVSGGDSIRLLGCAGWALRCSVAGRRRARRTRRG
jgi:hypothetical protein